MFNNNPKIAYWLLLLITGMLLLFTLLQTFYLYVDEQRQENETRQWAEQYTRTVAEDLAQTIQQISTIADQLAAQINAANCSPFNIEQLLHSMYLRYSGFSALGVAFDAAASGTEYRLYAPFIRQRHEAPKVERLDSFYDYLANTDEQDLLAAPEAWYHHAQKRERQWLEPFHDAALDEQVLRYTTPIYNAKQQKIGLVFVDINLEFLHDQIEKSDIKDNNYLFLISAKGKLLYDSLNCILKRDPKSEESCLENPHAQVVNNFLTREPAWQHRQTITATNWQLTSVIAKATTIISEKSDGPDKNGRFLHVLTSSDRVLWVLVVVTLVILVFSCLCLMRKRTNTIQLWTDTGIYTFILFAGVVSIWVFEYGAIDLSKSTILSNKAIIDKVKRDHAIDALKKHKDAPVYIPVGFFIQTIEFLSASNVNVTGYVWHRYQEGQESDYTVGTIFPEAIETNINLAYEKTENGEVLKGWYFETILRQNFDPNRFPLDRQSVWIRLWHEKIGGNIMLVPDTDSYDSLNTLSKPGVEKDFVLSGWKVFRSYFEIRENQYNTRLGIAANTPDEPVKELYFSVEITRNFINPFLAHLFPLFVVILMLFAIVITMSTDEEKKDFLGFNAAGVVASCSALFFVALVSHVQLRNELEANNVVYLEYFYLATYILILLVTLNAVLLSLKVRFVFILFQDNLLPKLMYPLAISSALFICTVWAFRHS